MNAIENRGGFQVKKEKRAPENPAAAAYAAKSEELIANSGMSPDEFAIQEAELRVAIGETNRETGTIRDIVDPGVLEAHPLHVVNEDDDDENIPPTGPRNDIEKGMSAGA